MNSEEFYSRKLRSRTINLNKPIDSALKKGEKARWRTEEEFGPCSRTQEHSVHCNMMGEWGNRMQNEEKFDIKNYLWGQRFNSHETKETDFMSPCTYEDFSLQQRECPHLVFLGDPESLELERDYLYVDLVSGKHFYQLD